MPPRRSHKKSRAGCRRCKIRKIKCDEVHPRCGKCVQHGVECDFENPDVVEMLLAAGTSTPVPSLKSEDAAAVPTPITTTFPPPASSDSMSASPTLTASNLSPQAADSTIKTPLSLSSASAAFTQAAASASTPPLLWPSPSLVVDETSTPTDGASHPHPHTMPIFSPSPSPLSPPPPQHLPLIHQPSLYPAGAGSSTASRLMEMRVLHQYTTSTYKTLPIEPSPRSDEMWQTHIPRFVFASSEAPYLIDALLSVAAMHLRSIDPNDMDVVRACHTYMVSSVAEYRAALAGGINDSNAEALFLTATLISFQSTASRFFLKDDATLDEDGDMDMEYFHPDQDYADEPFVPPSSNRSRSSYTLPLSWFHSFQGVKTIVATSWVKLRHSAAVQFIVDSQPILKLDLDAVTGGAGALSSSYSLSSAAAPPPSSSSSSTPDDPASLASLSFFGHLLDGVSDELAVEDDDEAGLGHLTRQSYLHAVAVLNWAHKSPHRSAALAFPATVAKRFLDLVEVRRPRALAILACFFALLKPLDEIWWLKDVARREVMGIVSLFERGSPWWRHLEWPVRIALFEGTDIPSDVWGADCSEERRQSLLKSASGQGGSVVDHIEMFTQAQAASVALGYAPV
jgi:hypothetical protein